MGQVGSAAGISLVSWASGKILGAPEGLPALEDIDSLAPNVVRVLGMNPSPAQLQGTNTYLVGTGTDRILVDTSDGNSYWWPMLQQALDKHGAKIQDLLLTHGHYDHSGGIEAVRQHFPEVRVWKLPCEATPHWVLTTPNALNLDGGERDDTLVPPPPPPISSEPVVPAPPVPLPENQSRARKSRLNLSETFKRAKGPMCACDANLPIDCSALSEGQEFRVEGAVLKVLLTPGHSEDSVTFFMEGYQGAPPALFVGDTVLGGTSSRFDDLTAYRESLRTLGSYTGLPGSVTLYTGHGKHVAARDSWSYIQSYKRTLDMREQAIKDVLRDKGASGVSDICSSLYGGGMTGLMAEGLIVCHLDEMVTKGMVKEEPGMLFGASYELIGN